MKAAYFDYAAATPLDPKVYEAMQPYYSDKFYNPSANYLAAREVKKDITVARESVAANLGCRPAEIIFTAGATEANNLAVKGIMNNWPDGEVLVSSIEHESVLAPAQKYSCKQIPVDAKGRVDTLQLERQITDKTVLVSIIYVNNEIGVIQSLSDIANLLNKLSKSRKENGNNRPLFLHTDAAQAPNYLDLKTSRLGVDLMTINGSKIYGPKQTGALYVRAGVILDPQIVGGGQEFGFRSGTENVAGIIGFSKALEIAQKKQRSEAERIGTLRDSLESKIIKALPSAKINGSIKRRAPHLSSITFPGVDNERLMMELDEQGLQVATGSACSASSDEPSHVLSAIGLNESDTRATIRFSLGRLTKEEDINLLVKSLTQIIE